MAPHCDTESCLCMVYSVSHETFSGNVKKMRRLLRARERRPRKRVAVSLRTLKSDFSGRQDYCLGQAASRMDTPMQERPHPPLAEDANVQEGAMVSDFPSLGWHFPSGRLRTGRPQPPRPSLLTPPGNAAAPPRLLLPPLLTDGENDTWQGREICPRPDTGKGQLQLKPRGPRLPPQHREWSPGLTQSGALSPNQP